MPLALEEMYTGKTIILIVPDLACIGMLNSYISSTFSPVTAEVFD